jgi:plasmid stability protein
MPNLSIKEVPEEWARKLRERAAANHRSLQGELMAILDEALHAPPAESMERKLALAAAAAAYFKDPTAAEDMAMYGHPVTRRGTKSIEQIAAEIRKRHPKPDTSLPLSVDIVRADRDSR